MSDLQEPASGPLAPVFREPTSPEPAPASPESPFQGATSQAAVSGEPKSPRRSRHPRASSRPPVSPGHTTPTAPTTPPGPTLSDPDSPAGATDPREPAVPLIIVDGANVVGSVPDGWWRDRAGAAIRLRDNLAAVPATGLPDVPAPVEVILVVEGKARNIPQDPHGVRIERAPGSGDDKIIDLVRNEPHPRRIIVITADRALRDRATTLGAETRGPSAVPR